MVAGGGGLWGLVELTDEPVMDTRLAGEGDALGGGEEAVERPVLGGGGERTAQGCNSARSALRAGRAVAVG